MPVELLSSEAPSLESAPEELDFEELHRDFGPRLLHFFISRGCKRDVADDLLQETLLGAWKSKHTFKPGRSVQSWIFAIAGYKLVDHFRGMNTLSRRTLSSWSEQKDGFIEPVDVRAHAPDELAEVREQLEIVLDFLDASSEEIDNDVLHRNFTALRLSTVGGMNTEEVGSITGLNTAQINVAVFNARQRLRLCGFEPSFAQRRKRAKTPSHSNN